MSCWRWLRTSQQLVWLIAAVVSMVTFINIYELKQLKSNSAVHESRNSIVGSAKVASPTQVARGNYYGDASDVTQAPRLCNAEITSPSVWIRGDHMETGYLDHVVTLFDRLGFARVEGPDDWQVLWMHGYPFVDPVLKTRLKNLSPFQKVNHIPGSGFYTSKVNLATSNITGVPRAFSMPADKERFLKYAQGHPDVKWVQKSNLHRGIKILDADKLNLNLKDSFIQQYISNPLLIDGRKFDVGIYVAVTSVYPLRLYCYSGEALLRFCPQNYEPFDAAILDKYVVGDDYTPTWEMPSLKTMYHEMQYTHKETLNAYLRDRGKDPEKIWQQVQEIIRSVFLAKHNSLRNLLSGYRNGGRNFFELSRFDFVIDSDLNVFLMEANMSPNLSSGHFPPNALLYEQVIYNLLSVVGVARAVRSPTLEPRSTREAQMSVSDKDLQANADYCRAEQCSACRDWKCSTCYRCLTPELRAALADAYLEHVNRRAMRRVWPKPMTQDEARLLKAEQFDASVKNLDRLDRIQHWWFRGKCLQDETWCS